MINNPDGLVLLYPNAEYRQQWLALEQDFLDMEFTLNTKHNVIKTISWSNISKKVPISGWAYWMIGVDISERKQMEDDLQRAKETAEAANRAKSTFLANMSHELRTPLNGILGYAQILQRDQTLTEKQQEGVNIIQRSGDYLLTLINDILDLSKVEADRMELYPVDIDFEGFIQSLVELFTIRAEQKHIAFLYEPLSYLPTGIRVDDKRLRQILINLLGNAIKFTEKGGVTFKVGYNEGKMRFQIEDTGQGIAKEDLETIFKPFKQVGTNDVKSEGTGLGLSITEKLVKMMDGKIQVNSELSKGSVFWVELDLLEVSNLVKSKQETQLPIIGLEGRARKILLIDDRWENRSVVTNLLAPLGFTIVEATNGQEGIEKMLECKPDLIIIDLVMPIMDGFEAVRQIRTIPSLTMLPIIASSASVFEEDQQKSITVGCNAFIPKPFHTDMLLTLIHKLLNITWIYGQPSGSAEQSLDETEEYNDSMPGPSEEQANILLDLAMMGDIQGILETIEIMEEESIELTSFVKKIRQLAKNFEEEKICELMQSYIT
jgi:signal transduction histidine kinase/DNA-binding NarL/FixJ family response regulator